jgi:hypothetical protein
MAGGMKILRITEATAGFTKGFGLPAQLHANEKWTA